ncbi:Uncharacterized protein TCM_027031 [Theobroma cacao]|uniref:DC1 domain-containing protein n=1 Tax=Theobroma cacao TaxID=3641 RepID=A0A061GF59_THECC|nr:Uncharacterized protein TCM_027031 [Theobroma cacao]
MSLWKDTFVHFRNMCVYIMKRDRTSLIAIYTKVNIRRWHNQMCYWLTTLGLFSIISNLVVSSNENPDPIGKKTFKTLVLEINVVTSENDKCAIHTHFYKFLFLRCHACHKSIIGQAYRCGSLFSSYQLHESCLAHVFTNIIFIILDHILWIPQNYVTDAKSMLVKHLYHCMECRIFLHIECVPVPHSIKSKCHIHHLTLKDHFVEDDSREYYCNLCKEEMTPENHVFCCEECDGQFVVHIECVLLTAKWPLEYGVALDTFRYPNMGKVMTKAKKERSM